MMAMCRPALAAAMLPTMGRLAAVNRAIAFGLPSASRSAVVSQAHHRAASGTLQGRIAAALISRATDSPRTIRTRSWNRSARCQGLTGTGRDGGSISSAPAASVSRAAPHKLYRVGPPAAREASHRTPAAPKKIRYLVYSALVALYTRYLIFFGAAGVLWLKK